jgi:hypothetical protein
MLSFWEKVRRQADHRLAWRFPATAAAAKITAAMPDHAAPSMKRKSDTDGHSRRRRQTLYDNRLL